ncbi:hypothetical protein NB574_05610 [Vibrio vulnificus]|nr:hypothetical protein [Vibrio cincinnatiensis]MCJ0812011.1 hypothetical protein [Vibrio vulnificus]MCR9702270.1 hypothetical protein [Vibrio vulnificus]
MITVLCGKLVVALAAP